MSIRAQDAIATARSLLGTPYSTLDCINLIKKVIRTSPGGVPGYTTAGTNTLWNSRNASGKYRDLTWSTCSVVSAKAGMLVFKCRGSDVHHVGIVTGEGTVIHASSAAGKVVETTLDGSWQLLGIHRYIEAEECPQTAEKADYGEGTLLEDENGREGMKMEGCRMRVVASSLNVRKAPGVGGTRIGRLACGEVVTVQEEMENGWKRVAYGEGGSGYVDGSYLEAVTENAESAALQIVIVDNAGNRFMPVGDWRVLIGGVD